MVVEQAWEEQRPSPGETTAAATVIEQLREELRQAREALAESRKSEQLLAGLIESAMDAIISVDEGQRIVLFNPAAERMFGLSAADALGQPIWRFIPERFRSAHTRHIRTFAGTGVSSGSMKTLGSISGLRTNGEEFPIEASVSQIQAQGSRLFTVILRDITERRRTEQALQERTERYELVLAGAQSAIWDWDVVARRVHFSAQWRAMRGVADEEVEDREEAWSTGIHPDDLDRVQAAVQAHFDGSTPVFAEEYRIRCRDGSLKWISNRGIVQRDADGRVIRMAGSESDITERKEIEQALRDSKADLNRAQSVAQIGSWRLNLQRNELHWSDQNHHIFGVPSGTPLSYETFLSVVHPDDREHVDHMWKAALLGEPYDIEHRLVVDGAVKWVREKAELEFDERGRLLGAFGTTQDITDIKLSEQALRESEARLQLATEIGRSGTWDWDVANGRVIWSRGHYEILGYREDEVSPSYQAWIDRVHPDDRARVEAEIQRSMTGRQDYTCEFRVVWPDGSVHWMISRGRCQYSGKGTCSRMIGVMADVTSLKQAELALLEADRRKDEFLAMLGHELRNPLTPIRNAAHVLGSLETQEPRLRWAREMIERQVGHLTRLVDDLLDVSRIVRGKVELRLEPIELAAVVNQALEMARPLTDARGHRIEARLPEQSIHLRADPVRLAQVLLNLLDNAAKYTPDGGEIGVEARGAGTSVEICVKDNGMGIPADLLPHVFDLFRQDERTPDRSQGGLGIGLTVAKQLVAMHGGQLQADSAGAGQGSVFTIRLPALSGKAATTASQAGAKAAPVTAAATATAGCRVLVVDDDPAVADSMAVLLEIDGHEVRTADSGETALELARTFRPRLVLLDIGLQGMDGYEVARRLRAGQTVDERLCLVAVTGYGHEEARARSKAAGFDRHLVKPVPPGALLELLAEIGNIQNGGTAGA